MPHNSITNFGAIVICYHILLCQCVTLALDRKSEFMLNCLVDTLIKIYRLFMMDFILVAGLLYINMPMLNCLGLY